MVGSIVCGNDKSWLMMNVDVSSCQKIATRAHWFFVNSRGADERGGILQQILYILTRGVTTFKIGR